MAKKLELIGGVPRMTDESGPPTIYDETSQPGSVSTGVAVTLPNSGTYESEELEIRLNGQRLDFGIDWNTVGVIPRTQVSFTFDLVAGDDINWRVDRDP